MEFKKEDMIDLNEQNVQNLASCNVLKTDDTVKNLNQQENISLGNQTG